MGVNGIHKSELAFLTNARSLREPQVMQQRIPPATLPSPWAEARRWVAEYERVGTLDELQLPRLIHAVNEIVVEHTAIVRAMMQLERVWPDVREGLNELHRTTTGHVGGDRRGSRDRRPGRTDPFGSRKRRKARRPPPPKGKRTTGRARIAVMGIVIVGAGGFGREVLGVLDASGWDAVEDGRSGERKFVGFLDDGSPDIARLAALGEGLLGGVAVLAELDATYLIGVGRPATRRSIDERAQAFGRRAHPAAIHATAAIGRRVALGAGAVVCPHTALTTNIEAGRHLHVNIGGMIGHDCRIGDYVTIGPGVVIAGGVTIGDGVEFGIGAMVLPGLTIGAGAMVGAGAVVTKAVEPGATVVGVPARQRHTG